MIHMHCGTSTTVDIRGTKYWFAFDFEEEQVHLWYWDQFRDGDDWRYFKTLMMNEALNLIINGELK